MQFKRAALTLALLIITLCVFSWKIDSSFNFHSDFARDITEMFEISKGDIKLLGPKSSFGGMYTNPSYYYTFVPFLILSNYNPTSVLYINAILFTFSIGFIYWLLTSKYPLVETFFVSLSIVLFPIFLISARNPGNATSYIALLSMLIVMIHVIKKPNWHHMLIFGFISGIILTTHYGNLIVISLLSVYLFYFNRSKRLILTYLIGFIAAVSPLLIFEFSHNFIMLKNTFIDQSYRMFVNNQLLANGIKNRNLIENAIFISNEIGKNSIFHPLIYLPIIFFIQYRLKREKKLSMLAVVASLSLLITIVVLRSQFVAFYIYSIGIIIFLTFLIILLNARSKILLFLLLGIFVIRFPFGFYANSSLPMETYISRTNFVINNNVISKNDSFNIIQIRHDTNLAPYGHEYRYFFLLNGYKPDKITDYSLSKKLIIFSETEDINPHSIKTWEMEQFGKDYSITNRKRFDNIEILLLQKKQML